MMFNNFSDHFMFSEHIGTYLTNNPLLLASCYLFIYLFFFFQRDELHEAAVRFSRRYGMDQCVGCLDGTYVPISRPVNNEGAYVTRHGYHALNVLVGYNFYTNYNLYNRLHLSPVKKQKTLI